MDKYTVSEISRMRQAIHSLYQHGVSCRRSERDADVERHLVTYMMNGTKPEELEEAVMDKARQDYETWKRANDFMNPPRKPTMTRDELNEAIARFKGGRRSDYE